MADASVLTARILSSALASDASPLESVNFTSSAWIVHGPSGLSHLRFSTRFIYNSSNGELRYDTDGTGTADPGIIILNLVGAPVLAASDFFMP